MREGQRLRVLQVITRLDRGGSAENTLLTAAGLDPERYEVTVAAGPTSGPPSPTEAEARERGVRFVRQPHLVRAPSPLRDPLALRQLIRLMREGRYALVHTHTSKAGVLGRLAARRAGVPRVVHTPHGHVFYGYYGPLLTGLFVRVERRAARWCDRLIALTAADRDDHLRFGVGAPERWVVIHSGVDFRPLDRPRRRRGDLRAELGIAAQALVVVTVGRLTAVKGQGDLVRAFADLRRGCPEAWLVLAGDGEQEGALRALATDLGVADRVVFTGWRQDVGDLLRAADIFALPSLNEGMGKALVEAMYLGLPVVATRVGGVPELIAEGREGLLVPPRCPAALAAALAGLAADGEGRRRMGQLGAARARGYSADSMVARIAALYEELVGAPTLPGTGAPQAGATAEEEIVGARR